MAPTILKRTPVQKKRAERAKDAEAAVRTLVAKGWTHERIATELNVTANAVWRWASGRNAPHPNQHVGLLKLK
jgi:transcriptional regulator with XRE-family HTH domain